jgi:hypothetical protein
MLVGMWLEMANAGHMHTFMQLELGMEFTN